MSATRQTVDTLLSRIVAGEVPDRIAELYADRVDWQVNWPSTEHLDVPWIRPRSTRADVADHHRTLAAATVPGQAEATVTGILVDGPDAVVFGQVAQTVRRTGRRFTARFALHLTVADGRIVRHHVYEDSLAIEAACRS